MKDMATRLLQFKAVSYFEFVLAPSKSLSTAALYTAAHFENML